MVISDVFVTPRGMKPASTRRWTAGALRSARRSLRATRPAQFGMPASEIDSLIVQGTPRKGGTSSWLRPMRSSAASASASAAAKRSQASALVRGWRASRRSTWAWTTSRAVTSRVRIARARPVALRRVSAGADAVIAMARTYRCARAAIGSAAGDLDLHRERDGPRVVHDAEVAAVGVFALVGEGDRGLAGRLRDDRSSGAVGSGADLGDPRVGDRRGHAVERVRERQARSGRA